MAETRATTNSEKIATLAAKFEGHDVTLLEMKQQLIVIAQFMQKVDQRLSNTKVRVKKIREGFRMWKTPLLYQVPSL